MTVMKERRLRDDSDLSKDHRDHTHAFHGRHPVPSWGKPLTVKEMRRAPGWTKPHTSITLIFRQSYTDFVRKPATFCHPVVIPPSTPRDPTSPLKRASGVQPPPGSLLKLPLRVARPSMSSDASASDRLSHGYAPASGANAARKSEPTIAEQRARLTHTACYRLRFRRRAARASRAPPLRRIVEDECDCSCVRRRDRVTHREKAIARFRRKFDPDRLSAAASALRRRVSLPPISGRASLPAMPTFRSTFGAGVWEPSLSVVGHGGGGS